MYLADGAVCLSLRGGFLGGWLGFGAAVFLPGVGGAAVPGTPVRSGRAAWAPPVLPAPGGGVIAVPPHGAVAVPGLGGTGGEAKFWPQLRGTADEAQMNIRRI